MKKTDYVTNSDLTIKSVEFHTGTHIGNNVLETAHMGPTAKYLREKVSAIEFDPKDRGVWIHTNVGATLVPYGNIKGIQFRSSVEEIEQPKSQAV